jgi:hypothetical protein
VPAVAFVAVVVVAAAEAASAPLAADAAAAAAGSSAAPADALVDAPAEVAPVFASEEGPLLPPRIEDRSSLAKLELRVERCPPSKPAAPADLSGSWAC